MASRSLPKMLAVKRMLRSLFCVSQPENTRKTVVLRGMRLRQFDSPHRFPGQPCRMRGRECARAGPSAGLPAKPPGRRRCRDYWWSSRPRPSIIPSPACGGGKKCWSGRAEMAGDLVAWEYFAHFRLLGDPAAPSNNGSTSHGNSYHQIECHENVPVVSKNADHRN
jgi:hypothetical protein